MRTDRAGAVDNDRPEPNTLKSCAAAPTRRRSLLLFCLPSFLCLLSTTHAQIHYAIRPHHHRQPMRFSRSAFRRAVCLGTFAIVSLLGCARRLADRAAAAANASSVRLVRLAMELQGELDA